MVQLIEMDDSFDRKYFQLS